jgi:Fe-S-cluster containining protein
MKDIDKILDEARASISKFCIEECKAYCCRKGHLTLTSKETELVTQNRTKEFEKQGTIRKSKGVFSLNFEKFCPSLKDCKCIIHKNPERPLVCQQFPIFITGQTIRLSKGCAAVTKGLFYPYEKQFLKLGYKLTIS